MIINAWVVLSMALLTIFFSLYGDYNIFCRLIGYDIINVAFAFRSPVKPTN